MNILLAVTGSIACYKAYDLCREFTKRGHQVKVICSKGALQFIKLETFRYLGAVEVYSASDDFNLEKYGPQTSVLHIELARWCDKLVIAPLSANTLSKLANGPYDDLLGSVFLAIKSKSILLFPAMNESMWTNPLIESSVQKLESALPHLWMAPTKSGEMICGETGAGKLLDLEEILALTETVDPFHNPTIHSIITTGATMAPVDPVRYMTNPASGLTGNILAKALLQAGHKVTVIAGECSDKSLNYLSNHPNLKIVKVKRAQEMLSAALELFPSCDNYISTAAICDYEFDESEHKQKKSVKTGHLNYHPAPDILATVLKMKTEHQTVISFAAETDVREEIFAEKWNRKPTELMVGNLVNSGLINNNQTKGFQGNDGEYYFVQNGKIVQKHFLTKMALAKKLVDFVNTRNL